MAGTALKPMPEYLACSCAQRLFPELQAAIEDDAEHGTKVPVAGVLFELDPPMARRSRHEQCHDEQAARFAPEWLPRWFPVTLQAWMGRREFWQEYERQHVQLGFFGNRFEIEARRAEDIFTNDSSGDLTPVNP